MKSKLLLFIMTLFSINAFAADVQDAAVQAAQELHDSGEKLVSHFRKDKNRNEVVEYLLSGLFGESRDVLPSYSLKVKVIHLTLHLYSLGYLVSDIEIAPAEGSFADYIAMVADYKQKKSNLKNAFYEGSEESPLMSDMDLVRTVSEKFIASDLVGGVDEEPNSDDIKKKNLQYILGVGGSAIIGLVDKLIAREASVVSVSGGGRPVPVGGAGGLGDGAAAAMPVGEDGEEKDNCGVLIRQIAGRFNSARSNREMLGDIAQMFGLDREMFLLGVSTPAHFVDKSKQLQGIFESQGVDFGAALPVGEGGVGDLIAEYRSSCHLKFLISKVSREAPSQEKTDKLRVLDIMNSPSFIFLSPSSPAFLQLPMMNACGTHAVVNAWKLEKMLTVPDGNQLFETAYLTVYGGGPDKFLKDTGVSDVHKRELKDFSDGPAFDGGVYSQELNNATTGQVWSDIIPKIGDEEFRKRVAVVVAPTKDWIIDAAAEPTDNMPEGGNYTNVLARSLGTFPFITHFVVNVGASHWVLISLYKTPGERPLIYYADSGLSGMSVSNIVENNSRRNFILWLYKNYVAGS